MPSRPTEIESAARLWSPIARFIEVEAGWGGGPSAGGGEAPTATNSSVRHQAGLGLPVRRSDVRPCRRHLFLHPRGGAIARYDFLLAAASRSRLSFSCSAGDMGGSPGHPGSSTVGTAMEVFKTPAGSWIYPEPSVIRSAACRCSRGSCMRRGQLSGARLASLRFPPHPPSTGGDPRVLATGIYVNFFAHHFITDLRVALFAATALLFGRTWVYFKVWRRHRRMPLLVGFALVALFIRLPNIGTATGTWALPALSRGRMVHGADREARLRVSPHDHVLRDGGRRPWAVPMPAICEDDEGARPVDAVPEAAGAGALGQSAPNLASFFSPALGVPAAGTVSRAGRPPRPVPNRPAAGRSRSRDPSPGRPAARPRSRSIAPGR